MTGYDHLPGLFIKLCCLFFILIQACSVTDNEIIRDDPLIGKIYDSRNLSEMDSADLISSVADYDLIYLSEKHDNPEHHRYQMEVIDKLVQAGKKPQVAFEFFSYTDTPVILNYLEIPYTEARESEQDIETALRKKLGWETRQDDMWKFYYDLLLVVRKNHLFAAGIDVSGEQIRRITHKGMHGLTEFEKKQIFKTDFADDSYRDYMFDVFKSVHCGMGNEKMQRRLYDTWKVRNDRMAYSLVQMSKPGSDSPVVVITGGGHTEYNLGVINRVAFLNKSLSQVNVGFQEISITPSVLADYMEPLDLEGYEPVPRYDYVWFTQRVSYQDPCEEFREQLKNLKMKR